MGARGFTTLVALSAVEHHRHPPPTNNNNIITTTAFMDRVVAERSA